MKIKKLLIGIALFTTWVTSGNANEIPAGGTGQVTLVTSITSTVSSVTVGSASGLNAKYIASNTTGSFKQEGSTVTITFDVTLTDDAPVGDMSVYFSVLIVTSSSMSNLLYSVTIEVTEPAGLKANFTAIPTSGEPPLTVQFTNLSTGSIVSFNWDFGDGSSSTEEEPSHIYSSIGSYTVILTVIGTDSTVVLEKQDFINVYNQLNVTFGPQKVLNSNSEYVYYACTADLNADGKTDIISSAGGDYTNWYKNLGNGSFGSPVRVSNSAWAEICAIPADINGDGKIDILSGSPSNKSIVWYENSGTGAFSNAKTISNAVDLPLCVYAKDLDNDGDLDVLSASQDDKKIAWYQNNGDETFGEQNIMTSSANNAHCVFADDIDGDGLNDIIADAMDIFWYKNNGTGYFSNNKSIDDLRDAQSIHTVDIDQDGDIDIVTAYFNPGEILWYKNNGNAEFSLGNVIYSDAFYARYAYPADLDNDGDCDIIAATAEPDEIMWFENKGGGAFGSKKSISTQVKNPMSVVAADLDGDNDLDVLSSSYGDNKVAWYENLGIYTSLNTPETGDPLQVNGLSIYPNPAKDYLIINTGNYSEMTDYSIKIVNELGATVFETEVTQPSYEINLSTWTGKGLYVLQVYDNNNTIKAVKKIILQ